MSAAAAIFDRLEHFSGSTYQTRMYETLRGEGDFWPSGPDWVKQYPKHDVEQQLAIFYAVQRACQCQGTPADRWAIVEREVVKLAHEYAVDK